MSYKVCNKIIYAGAVNVLAATVVGYASGFTYTPSAARIDVTTDCNEAFLGGVISRPFTISGFSRHLSGTDPVQDVGQALIIEGANISLMIQPNGAGAGKPQLSCLDAFIESVAWAGDAQGAWTWNVAGFFNVAPSDDPQA